MNPAELWKDHKIEPAVTQWAVGPVQVLFYREDKDILIYNSVEPEPLKTGVLTNFEPEEGIQWQRWCYNTKVDSLAIHPAMPDRPILVFTSDVMNLPVGAKVVVYVSIPVTVKALVKTKKIDNVFCQVPSQTLSNTWFGTNFEGEICYALKSLAHLEVKELEWSDHAVICPVEIRNNSDTPFKLERLCIRPRFLNIYTGQQHLWTNRVIITYRGEGEMSKINYQQSAPAEANNPIKLVDAEEVVPEGMIRRTFYNLVSSRI